MERSKKFERSSNYKPYEDMPFEDEVVYKLIGLFLVQNNGFLKWADVVKRLVSDVEDRDCKAEMRVYLNKLHSAYIGDCHRDMDGLFNGI